MIRAIIIEDDPMVAQINRRYLSVFDNVEIAGVFSNGLQALEYLQKMPADLALVDITMPGLSGDLLVEKCRAMGVSTDFIMVTAANDIEHVNRMLRSGVVDYLVKPFSMERFNQAIEKYLRRKAIVGSRHALNQEDLDRMVGAAAVQQYRENELPKGLQQSTLNTIVHFLRAHPRASHSCESLSKTVNLSSVTVRRYLNYLVKANQLDARVCYETGGRPSLMYVLKTTDDQNRH
ncbi:MAG: response regulator [Clostridia bacterium]|nr:response regulator [Clostridia bacterium]